MTSTDDIEILASSTFFFLVIAGGTSGDHLQVWLWETLGALSLMLLLFVFDYRCTDNVHLAPYVKSSSSDDYVWFWTDCHYHGDELWLANTNG